ncbi:RagB/SusD family nutrient uptake outer membrane protein [Flavobacterium pectinovorum]|uniref:RagB/SusD family nutrient uptake outer membrane protein n=1 Tax=Flavobacterium pectinovorum TaxID=29533 RepID=UPI001FAC163D|nr:RagB/SusD family nutrient uptake outer membrane protein [Flavobacterium pectinovorum]MCI9845514.1 RagB/SusD family nutrient uptake outer membrane protein [Flavobacterium pectinovorum]
MKNYLKNIAFKSVFCTFSLVTFFLVFTSCDDFVDVGAPETQVGMDFVFSNDATATGSILGLYDAVKNNLTPMYSGVLGTSSDELETSFPFSYGEFASNEISVNSYTLRYNIWMPSYAVIMQSNLAIKSLTESTTLTPSVKNQLLGEAKFMRAFVNFYLVNTFGDIPLPLGSNVIENAELPRASSAEVWIQITKDLIEAQELLGENYPSTSFRTRINKSVANAFLARVYLYQKDWLNAEIEATKLITNANYELVDLNNKFLNSSNETILQFHNVRGISNLGFIYQKKPGYIPDFYLANTMADSFEDNDLRKSVWTKEITIGSMSYSTIYKYQDIENNGDEYDVVLRLAEQYLIRAEARAHLNNIDGASGALADLNVIREKAGLDGLSGLNQAQTLLAVENERKFELFGEWGHRWFDLKRTPSLNNSALTRADDVISVIKDTWKSTSVLYPIPAEERRLNTNLTQNPGYEF